MSSPIITSFEAEQQKSNADLMWKAVGGIIFSAPMTTAVPAAFTNGATADLIELPAAWTRLGLVAKSDGITFSRDIGSEDTESWGYLEPTRTDITSDASSAQFTLQETKRAVLEMYDFVDLSAVTADSTTGEYSYNKPTVSNPNFRRLIFMGVDKAGTARRYRWKVMPRAQVSAVDDQSWSQSTIAAYPMTIQAKVDPVLGYAVRNVFGGPGQKALNVASGFSS